MTSAIHSDRNITPFELINVLAGSHVGEIVNTDVPNTTLVSDFITLVVTQLAITIEIHEAYHLYKDEVMLDTTKTLDESGVVANDIVHLRVTVYLT
jgi:hypothetical protein